MPARSTTRPGARIRSISSARPRTASSLSGTPLPTTRCRPSSCARCGSWPVPMRPLAPSLPRAASTTAAPSGRSRRSWLRRSRSRSLTATRASSPPASSLMTTRSSPPLATPRPSSGTSRRRCRSAPSWATRPTPSPCTSARPPTTSLPPPPWTRRCASGTCGPARTCSASRGCRPTSTACASSRAAMRWPPATTAARSASLICAPTRPSPASSTTTSRPASPASASPTAAASSLPATTTTSSACGTPSPATASPRSTRTSSASPASRSPRTACPSAPSAGTRPCRSGPSERCGGCKLSSCLRVDS
eukprot:m.121892 g.121892  ORF g.121892 m.121892 type:complete len:306 (+) comp16210_c0_seq6:388-1305(+)